MDDTKITQSVFVKMKLPEYSTWKCRLADGFYIHPLKGNEPSRFYRIMQRLLLGFKWENTINS